MSPQSPESYSWPPLNLASERPCPARLADGPLRCIRLGKHETHVYAASSAAQVGDTEPTGSDER